MEKTYTLRHLTASDTFPMMKIIRKIGVKEFKKCFETEEVKAMIMEAKENGVEADAGKIGMNVALDAAQILIERLPECDKEIFAFLSGLSGMDAEEIAAIPFSTFCNMLIDVFTDKEFSDFFTAVSRLFK